MPSLTAPVPRASLAVVPLIADKRYYDETPMRLWGGLPPYPREWAGRLAVGEGPEAGLLGKPTWAGALNRDSGNQQRSKACAAWPLIRQVGNLSPGPDGGSRGRRRWESVGRGYLR